ncbi:hypothetical protein ACSBR1_028426 [Camellia fascicularis]
MRNSSSKTPLSQKMKNTHSKTPLSQKGRKFLIVNLSIQKEDLVTKASFNPRRKHHVCMPSYFNETEELVNYEPSRIENDPDHYANTLQDNIKFKQFFNQLRLSREARTKITKSIINIVEAHHKGGVTVKGSIPRKAREQTSAIIFSEAD